MDPAVLVLLALAALLVLPGLGGLLLWADEGDTAVFARTILERGLPYAWDGRTFTESDRGLRLTDDLLMVGTPWLPYYLTAGSFAVLGPSAFAARLPFALCALVAVLALHRLVLRTSGDRRAALAAGLLLLASVQFLLYARQCRHYAPNMALSLLLALSFLRLETRRRDPWLVVLGLLLFHTQPLPAAASLGALAGLTLVYPRFRGLRGPLFVRLALIAALAAPWLLLSASPYSVNAQPLTGLADLLPRLGQFGLEAMEAVPVLGWLVLSALAWRRLSAGDRDLLALAGATLGAYLVLTSIAFGPWKQWQYGLRYACPIIPLAAAVSGLLIARAAAGRLAPLAALLVLFGFTHLPGSTLPWLFAPPRPPPKEAEQLAFHLPPPGVARILRSEWASFPRELVEPNPGTVAGIVEFLDDHASPEQLIVTNYAWEPLYFHTGLRQALKILPDYRIALAAKRHGLPDYVFTPQGADWVIWRFPWEGYQGYHLASVVASLAQAGKRLEPAAALPETIWENRPELHLHRFPGQRYLYPTDTERLQLGAFLHAMIYRVVED